MNNTTSTDYLRPGDVWSKVFLIINHIIILPIILGNTLVLVSYAKSAYVRNCPINKLLVNLAISDLFTGLIGIPWTCWVHYGPYGWDALKYPCLLSYAAGHIPLGVSCITMFFIGLVRCVMVLKPIKYKIWITHSKMKIVNFFSWIYFVIIVMFYIFFFNNWHDGLPCDLSLVLGSHYEIMLGAHLAIVAVIWTGFYIIFIRTIKKSRHVRYGRAHNTNLKVERKKTIMVMILVACYYVCWIPSVTYALINTIAFPNVPEPKWSHLFQQFALFLMFTNSLMNPFIYAGFNPCFRDGFRVISRDVMNYSLTHTSYSSSFIRLNQVE